MKFLHLKVFMCIYLEVWEYFQHGLSFSSHVRRFFELFFCERYSIFYKIKQKSKYNLPDRIRTASMLYTIEGLLDSQFC